MDDQWSANVKATNGRTTHTRVASVASNMRRTLSSASKRVRFCGRILIAEKSNDHKFHWAKNFFKRCGSSYLLVRELFASTWKWSLRATPNKIARRKSWTTSHAKRCCKNFADNYNRNPSLKSDDCQSERKESTCFESPWMVEALIIFLCTALKPTRWIRIQVNSVSGPSCERYARQP